MIIWLNGTFGVGKSTTAALLEQQVENSRVFDPERVGEMLCANFSDYHYSDFQDLRPWRELVPLSLQSVHQFTGSRLIAPQTVLTQDYWLEMMAAMQDLALDVTHVLLDCSEEELRDRIDGDEVQGPSLWRHNHVSQYLEQRHWMMTGADLVIDTVAMSPRAVADHLSRELGLPRA